MDDADRAQHVSDQIVERIMAQARALNAAPPVDRPGPRICIDCPDHIEAARLAANPGALRCTPCQAEAEAARRGAAA
ncbi:TraR/DksA C4-type zinc finger protein [Brevundimonas vitis]|uniref:TraR/DksA C4-type zinc finger protein n=1 Tax=Brevundimonas vitisensis TaxID=2800818 RepID=A0ABX7BQ17_9CAUL|nr:TraR/DksA C4-type zinc finger protein [Brevundimonas vitisensis]QQQ19688.1 TraR/DksA C4-type zinc finger protein [Brevundimonas vitisensis]